MKRILSIVVPALLFLVILPGCAMIGQSVGTGIDRANDSTVEIPADSLQVYPTKTLVLIQSTDGENIYGFPLEVEHGDHLLMRDRWSSGFQIVTNVEWDRIDHVYLVQSDDKAARAGFVAGMPLDYLGAMLLTSFIGAVAYGIFVAR